MSPPRADQNTGPVGFGRILADHAPACEDGPCYCEVNALGK